MNNRVCLYPIFVIVCFGFAMSAWCFGSPSSDSDDGETGCVGWNFQAPSTDEEDDDRDAGQALPDQMIATTRRPD